MRNAHEEATNQHITTRAHVQHICAAMFATQGYLKNAHDNTHSYNECPRCKRRCIRCQRGSEVGARAETARYALEAMRNTHEEATAQHITTRAHV